MLPGPKKYHKEPGKHRMFPGPGGKTFANQLWKCWSEIINQLKGIEHIGGEGGYEELISEIKDELAELLIH